MSAKMDEIGDIFDWISLQCLCHGGCLGYSAIVSIASIETMDTLIMDKDCRVLDV